MKAWEMSKFYLQREIAKVFFSAINCGADAIYLGIDEFNARANIKNFNLENLKNYVDYAHLFGVKIYLALNILLRNDEFEKIDEIISKALEAKVDAFIVQDIGLVNYINHVYPNLEKHASTQMGISNVSGAMFVDKLGFKRIVLARESNLKDIKQIKNETNLDLEYFVQGALCVSFSGNCYLCSLLNSSSGNRGKCKQFCRLNWSLDDGNTKRKGYLLSTKDICLASRLKELQLAGVNSFKIEGRARRSAYVGGATKIYKKVLETDIFDETDEKNLKKLYNRGEYCESYLNGDKIIYPLSQNHIGQKIGKLIKCKTGKRFNELFIESQEKICKGDGLKFFLNGKEIDTISAQDVKKSGEFFVITTKHVIQSGAEVRKIVDAKLDNEILSTKRTIPVSIFLDAHVGRKAVLTLKAQHSEVEILSEKVLEKAKTQALTEEDAKASIGKLGEMFSLGHFHFFSDGVFITKSALNSLRREGMQKLKEKILERYEKIEDLARKCQKKSRKYQISPKNEEISKDKKIYIFDDFNKVPTFEKENLYVYQPEIYNEELLEIYNKYPFKNIFLALPVKVSTYSCDEIKNLLEKMQNWGVLVRNYGELEFKTTEKTIIGTEMNVTNDYAVKFYTSLGYKNIILSQEDFAENVHSFGANLFKLTSYYPEYMQFTHCPAKEFLGSKCDKCKYNKGITYHLSGKDFSLARRKIAFSCTFVLKSVDRIERNRENYCEAIEL